jgi:viroplasmin and RNaseH domain-containing protein
MTKKKFYAIAVGRKTGIFEAKWELVMEYTDKEKKEKHKGFNTLQEAKEWWKIHSKELPIVYEVKFDSKTNEKLLIPKKEEEGLW